MMIKMYELRAVRESKKLTRKDLSKLSGVSSVNIEKLETGKTIVENVKLSTLIKLSVALKVKVVDLLPKDLHRYIR